MSEYPAFSFQPLMIHRIRLGQPNSQPNLPHRRVLVSESVSHVGSTWLQDARDHLQKPCEDPSLPADTRSAYWGAYKAYLDAFTRDQMGGT
jgi:hypothetical protein